MKFFLIILFALFSSKVLAQPLVYLKAIAGTYKMEEMKSLQKEMVSNFQQGGVETKINSSFPTSIQGDAGMDFQGKSFSIGFLLNYSSTKGRISGNNIVAEQNLLRLMVGVKGSKKIYKNFSLYSKIGINYSQLDIKSAGGQASNGENTFASNGFSIEPGLAWKYSYHRFKLLADLGYELNANFVMTSKDVDNTYMANYKYELAGSRKADWSGLRLGIGVAFVIVDHKAWVDPNLKK